MERIGPYRIVESLGVGGMAHVWRGVDDQGREAAVKVLDANLARSLKARTRFYSEANNMAAIQHDNVVQVYDQGEDNGVIWLSMELLDGGSTDVWIRRHGPMAPRMAVEVVIAVLEGLEAVHAAGVVHRDMKPSNVLLGSDGRIKITDFGIARSDDSDAKPAKGKVTGTWAYMAPEQRVDPTTVDQRADVYGAGGTLWALLTGHDPADLVAPEAIDTLPAPAELVGIVRRALRFNPEDRYPTAAMMRADLEIAGVTLPPVPAGTPPLGEALLSEVPANPVNDRNLPKGWNASAATPRRTLDEAPRATPYVHERAYAVDDEPPAPKPAPLPPPPPEPAAGPPLVLIVVFSMVSLVGAAGVLFAFTSTAPADEEVAVDPFAPIVPEGVEIIAPTTDAATAPEPPAPAKGTKSPAKPGRLQLLSPAAALVSIDGQAIGELPVEVEIPAGFYRVRMHQKEGAGEASLRVAIESEAANETCWSFARGDFCSEAELTLARSKW